MRFNRIFVTGGTGYIGKSLLDYRLHRTDLLGGAALVFLARTPEVFISQYPRLALQPGVSFVKGDVRDFKMPDGPFDAVIHAASPVQGAASDDEIMATNIEGTRRVIQFAEKVGVKRLLFTSSGAVYGRCLVPPNEDFVQKPLTAYGVAKMKAEQLCINSGIVTCVARIFAEIGPYLPRNAGFAVGNFIQDCIEDRFIEIKGDGRSFRSYLYSDDLIEWLSTILEQGGENRVYNVGSPNGVTIQTLAETVSRICGGRKGFKVLGRSDGCEPEHYYPNVCRAESELGLKVRVDLITAIKKTFEIVRKSI